MSSVIRLVNNIRHGRSPAGVKEDGSGVVGRYFNDTSIDRLVNEQRKRKKKGRKVVPTLRVGTRGIRQGNRIKMEKLCRVCLH